MKTLTAEQKKRIWADVVAEFPNDRVMQEVHFARLIHHATLKNESPAAQIAFFRQTAEEALPRGETNVSVPVK